jgi:EAL domain-containing protein (putative c-di-GMP-specific phosphodiesterase class I)
MYRPEQDQHGPERPATITQLRRAIQQDQLVLHYQPQVGLADSRLVGAEALARWRHPERGLLGPGQLTTLAERTGLIGSLTTRVLDATLGQAGVWRAAGLDVPVAINVPARTLFDPTLPELLAERLAAHALPPDRLCLEVSENLFTDPEAAIEVLERLRVLGLRVSVANFGTGRLSLAHLTRLPADELKIDRSLLAHISRSLPAHEFARWASRWHQVPSGGAIAAA